MDEDRDLLEKFRKGDKDAFNDILKKHYKKVLNLIYRFYRVDGHEAEDIAQEVFLRIYRGLERFEGRSTFFTYLFRVTMNLCLKKRKTRWREAPVEGGDLPECSDEGNTVERALHRKELSEIVRKEVWSLPEEQRAVVVLHRFHDMAYEDIADTLKISLSAVKSRLHRARITLKERLSCHREDYGR